MKEAKFIYLKNAEKSSNKVRLPIKFVQEHGHTYYMYVYDDCIVLKPIGKNDDIKK